jgi:hypothetical protein
VEDRGESYVRKWLKKHGFPFEMWVAQTLRETEFQVVHPAYYRDVKTGETRDADVNAFRILSHSVEESHYLIDIEATFECKTSVDPWVAFTWNQNHAMGETMWLGNANVKQLMGPAFWGIKPPHLKLNPVSGPKAWGLLQAGHEEGKRDTAYNAARQVFDAAQGLASQADDVTLFSLVIPVLVLDSPLFSASLGSSKELVVESIPSILYRHTPSDGVGSLLMHVVTREAFPGFAAHLKQDFETLVRFMIDRLDKHPELRLQLKTSSRPRSDS